MMKLYQLYSNIISKSIQSDDYYVLFDSQKVIQQSLKPIIKEYFDSPIPAFLKDKTIEVQIEGLKDCYQ